MNKRRDTVFFDAGGVLLDETEHEQLRAEIIVEIIEKIQSGYTKEEFSLTKPDTRYFELILRKAGVEAENSIMVGDRIDKDIIPAKMIGMKTIRIRIGIHKGQEPRQYEEIPDYEIDAIVELLEILK